MRKKKNAKSEILKNAIPSYDWMNRWDYKDENQGWLRKSGNVAFEVLEVLDKKKMSQSQLAEKLGISRQQVSKIVKGHENLTLETLTKLEVALGIKLGKVLDEEWPKVRGKVLGKKKGRA